MKLRKVWILAVVLCLGGGLAHADKKSDAEAKRLYEDGTKFYSLGDFPTAIADYKKAFALKPDPVLLYNIAQAYRLSNDFEQSLFFYKSFLRNLPDAPNREEVEKRIEQVESALAKQKATANAPPMGTVAPGSKLPTDGTATTTEPGTTGTTTTTEPGKGTGTTATSAKPEGTTKLPGPDKVAEAGAASEPPGTSLPTASDSGGKKPIYKKWWFWAGVGAVAVGTAVIVAASSGGSGGAPSGHFGSQDVF